MKKIAEQERKRTVKQIDAMLFHRIVPEHHVPVFQYIRSRIEKDEPFEIDGHILLSAYRQFLRGVHLKTLNKNHPCHQRQYKGQHLKKRKSKPRSAATKAKIAESQRLRHAKRQAVKRIKTLI